MQPRKEDTVAAKTEEMSIKRINSENSPEFARRLKEISAMLMKKNAEAYKELSYR